MRGMLFPSWLVLGRPDAAELPELADHVRLVTVPTLDRQAAPVEITAARYLCQRRLKATNPGVLLRVEPDDVPELAGEVTLAKPGRFNQFADR